MTKEKIIVKVDPELRDLALGFIDRRKKEIPLWWESLNKNDFATLELFGHRLKGNAGSYGFDPLGLMGAEVEINAKFAEKEKIELALRGIEDYLERLEVIFEKAS